MKEKNITWTDLESSEMFQKMLSDFLFDLSNAKEQYNFKFDGELVCNKAAPKILVMILNSRLKDDYMNDSLGHPAETSVWYVFVSATPI